MNYYFDFFSSFFAPTFFQIFWQLPVNSESIPIETLICICFVCCVVNKEYLIFLSFFFVLLFAHVYLFIYSFLFEWHLLAWCEFHGIVYAELHTLFNVQFHNIVAVVFLFVSFFNFFSSTNIGIQLLFEQQWKPTRKEKKWWLHKQSVDKNEMKKPKKEIGNEHVVIMLII